MYAWKPVAQALGQQGIATQENGVWYVDLPRLTQAVEANRSWNELGYFAQPQSADLHHRSDQE